MNPNNTNLPDNLLSRVNRLYVSQNEFKDDSDKTVQYKRLVVEVSVKDEPVSIELKADKKDLLILGIADVQQEQKTF